MKLPNDVCRCHDGGCARSIVCARYTQRNKVGEWTSHAQTMKDHNSDCFFFIDDNTAVEQKK